jgi:diguanylate cyclase (GGDEF)-like protein
VHVLDTGNHAEFSTKLSVVALQLKGIVAVPLLGRDGMGGILYVDSSSKSMAALEAGLAKLTAIAKAASLAIENARLHEQTTMDLKTGLYSREMLMLRSRQEYERSNRYQRPVSLLMIDIDLFGAFNEIHGRDKGDKALALVARVMKTNCRQEIDCPGRYSGEKLALLLPETGLEQAFMVAERIREKIRQVPIAGARGTLHVTVSIGVAEAPATAGTLDDLYAQAERALLRAKTDGRDRSLRYAP